MRLHLLILTFILLRYVRGDASGNWGYRTNQLFKSPEHWKELYSQCGGHRQSPINIDTKKTKYLADLKPIIVRENISSSNIKSNIKPMTIELSVPGTWHIANIIHDEEGCFKSVGIHWHWGSKDSQGSEHTLNNNAYSIEGHIVTYKCKFESLHDALGSSDGIYVFGFLYKIGYENDAINKLFSIIDNKTSIQISLKDFLPKDNSAYFRYKGSLTTPPCNESVIWTVFSEIQTISQNQLSKFRAFNFSSPESGNMVDNFRPVQNNDKDVYSSLKIYNNGIIPELQAKLLPTLVMSSTIYLIISFL